MNSEGTCFARLPHGAWPAVDRLRDRGSLEVAVDAESIWLRGLAADVDAARRLAGARQFRLVHDSDDMMVALSGPSRATGAERRPSDLATHQLPADGWRPILELTSVRAVPMAAASARAGFAAPSIPAERGRTSGEGAAAIVPTTVSVVRGGPPRPAAALRLPLTELLAWAIGAPTRRLSGLVFAASPSGDALVMGGGASRWVLPAISGQTYWAHGPVLVACGFRPQPDVDPAVIADALGLETGLETGSADRAFLGPAGADLVAGDAWVALTRSSLRETMSDWAASKHEGRVT